MIPKNGLRVALIWCMGFLLIGLSHRAMANPDLGSPDPMKLPSDPFSFQPGPGRSIASSYCGICHSAEYIYTQPPHSQKTWGKIVHKMKSAYGCSIPDDQIPTLVEYLVGQNGVQPTPVVEEARTQEPASPKSQGTVNKGKPVYTKYCLNCHGTEGKGDGPLGQVLNPPAADLTATGDTSDQILLNAIRNGRPGTSMPPWKGDLSSQEIQEVLAYIRSFRQ